MGRHWFKFPLSIIPRWIQEKDATRTVKTTVIETRLAWDLSLVQANLATTATTGFDAILVQTRRPEFSWRKENPMASVGAKSRNPVIVVQVDVFPKLRRRLSRPVLHHRPNRPFLWTSRVSVARMRAVPGVKLRKSLMTIQVFVFATGSRRDILVAAVTLALEATPRQGVELLIASEMFLYLFGPS